MSAGAVLLRFFEFLAEAAPHLVEGVRGVMAAFWSANIADLGPVPPDLRAFKTVDDRIDARLAKALKPSSR